MNVAKYIVGGVFIALLIAFCIVQIVGIVKDVKKNKLNKKENNKDDSSSTNS